MTDRDEKVMRMEALDAELTLSREQLEALWEVMDPLLPAHLAGELSKMDYTDDKMREELKSLRAKLAEAEARVHRLENALLAFPDATGSEIEIAYARRLAAWWLERVVPMIRELGAGRVDTEAHLFAARRAGGETT